jgi:hypothetical protein
MKSHKRQNKKTRFDLYNVEKVEPDLSYWLEHIVHWHILLGVCILAVVFFLHSEIVLNW